jgi:integrase
MPHFPKPFFRASRGLWYVQVAGRQHNLGPDEDAAFKIYHELMARPREKAAVRTQSVIAVVDAFLDYVQQHRASETYRWYKDNLQRFCNFIPRPLLLSDLKPYHVQQWIDSYPNLPSGTKRNYCRSILRAMRWAEEQGYVERSPLAHFRKPAAGKRELVVSKTHYAQLLNHTKDQEFKDLLTVTWETGCRPQESLRVEARHVDGDKNRWIFPASEAKGGKSPRIVYLTPKAIEITLRLAAKHPVGPLFRNTDGAPWTPDACNCRFATLKKKLGVRYCLYALRHTWMNRMLMTGVDALTVAVLAGHRDPSTLAKTYQHLSQSPAFLLAQARRASA